MEEKNQELNSEKIQRFDVDTSNEKVVEACHSLENDSDTLEPFDDESEHREVNVDDPHDLIHWADQFQISVDELKSAIALNGKSVRAIIKYLSV